MSENGNYSAYPFEHAHSYAQGLTKRELIAAMAMQGYCANSPIGSEDYVDIAVFSREQADALIAELSKEQP